LVVEETAISRASPERVAAGYYGIASGDVCQGCRTRRGELVVGRRGEPLEAMRGVVQWLAAPRKRLLVSLDWVQVRCSACRVVALAYVLLVMIGLHASPQFRSGRWCSSNRSGEGSLFLAGRFMQDLPLPPLIRLAAKLRRELAGRNWG
jgi:hypothetical protein